MQSPYDQKPWLKTYPEWMPASWPEPSASILDVFENSVGTHPQAPCLYYFQKDYTFEQVQEMSSALGLALEELGVEQGDRVICDLQNIPQMVISCLAIWKLGGVVVPVNPMYKAKDLEYFISDARAKILICQDDLYEPEIRKAIRSFTEVKVITTSPLDLLDSSQPWPDQLAKTAKLSFDDSYDFMQLINQRQKAEPRSGSRPKPRDLAYLVYTSGTTGPPKGAMLTHANIVFNCQTYHVACRMDEQDVILGVAPLFHVTGIVAHMAVGFYLGIPCVFFHRFQPAEILKLIQRCRVTFTVAPITVYIALLNHPELSTYDLSSFRKPYSGGAPVSPGIVQKYQKATGSYVYNVYGLTESSSPVTITPMGMEAPVDEESGALSVGLIIPGHEAWIVDVQEAEKEKPLGEEGELVLRGPAITQGYWGKPEETEHAIRNGCFYTGDVAKIDQQGWCYIVDRKKDLINVSGFKVWPREVEDVLYTHPAVKEAAVVGIEDAYRGENVKAFVSLNQEYKQVTAQELISFCQEHLAAYKYPRFIEIIEEIPKTATGKFLRRELRNRQKQ